VLFYIYKHIKHTTLIDTHICEQKIAIFKLLFQAILHIRAERSKYFWANRCMCHNSL